MLRISNFENFENKVMEMLLCGENEVLEKLRRQFKTAKVKRREFTGVGFFTDFTVEKNLDFSINNKTFCYGDVYSNERGIVGDLGFILFIKNGYIDMLEGYTVYDVWPKECESIHLTYDTGGKRDIEKISVAWI